MHARSRNLPAHAGVAALAWCCAIVSFSVCFQLRASEVATKLVDRHAQDCALHLALPANWTLQAERTDDACVVTASEPAHAARCEAVDEKKFCQADHRIVVNVLRGSIQELSKSDATDNSPFAFRDGKWQFRDDWSEHEATLLLPSQRKLLLADYATREYYEDGSYCCVARVWWALADLPAHRVARVEFSWDGISWDDDTMSWDEATDRRSRNNVESFLRSLR